MLVENVNMQMEAEVSDLIDRRQIALYGAQLHTSSANGVAKKSEVNALNAVKVGVSSRNNKGVF